MKIGQLVKKFIPNIFAHCIAKEPQEFIYLQDKAYSNSTFGIGFPFCSKLEIANENSKRYWTTQYEVHGKIYRVSSQWNINHKMPFLNYLKTKKIISSEKYIELNRIVNYTPSNRSPQHKQKTAPYIGTNITFEADEHFEEELISEANDMKDYYTIFYCLERSIRNLVIKVMQKNFGDNWFEQLDRRIKQNVERNISYEYETALSKRSIHEIDYTTFGDLRHIIIGNWEVFEPYFERSKSVVEGILGNINRLRGSIAHCSKFSDKDRRRFNIQLEDWFDVLKKEH